MATGDEIIEYLRHHSIREIEDRKRNPHKYILQELFGTNTFWDYFEEECDKARRLYYLEHGREELEPED